MATPALNLGDRVRYVGGTTQGQFNKLATVTRVGHWDGAYWRYDVAYDDGTTAASSRIREINLKLEVRRTATPLDLTFRVDDEVYFHGSGTRCPARILHLYDDGDGLIATMRWKHGPRYDDFTQSEVKVRNLTFACHNHGAPFERQTLDEPAMFADGEHSGLAIGLAGQFYQAGGPGGVKLATGLKPCRHQEQHNEFDQRNNAAWKRGWKAGQERAKMAINLDFTRKLRTVHDHKPVTYVGPLNDLHVVAVNGAPPPIMIDNRGKVFDASNPYGMVIENVPEPVTTVIRFRPDGVCLGANYKGTTTPQDILVTVRIEEGMVTLLEPNR